MANTRREENLDEGNNNGLEGTVEILERIYTDKDQPGASPSLDESLRCISQFVNQHFFIRDSGKSRADLWAFAALMAVEFGKETTNIACIEGDSSPRSHSAGNQEVDEIFTTGSTALVFVFIILVSRLVRSRCRVRSSSRQGVPTALRFLIIFHFFSLTLVSLERRRVWLQGDERGSSPEPRWKRPFHHRVLPRFLCHDWQGGAAVSNPQYSKIEQL